MNEREQAVAQAFSNIARQLCDILGEQKRSKSFYYKNFNNIGKMRKYVTECEDYAKINPQFLEE